MTPTSLVPEQAAYCGMSFRASCAAGSWRTRHAIGEGGTQSRATRRGKTVRRAARGARAMPGVAAGFGRGAKPRESIARASGCALCCTFRRPMLVMTCG